MPLEPDGYPVNVTSGTPTITTLTVRWDEMKRKLENGIIRGYTVAVFEMDGTSKTNVTVYGSNNRTAVVTGLDIWVNYTVRVSAFTIIGHGPLSIPQRMTTDEQG